MGLDMYLKATRYVSGYDFENKEEKKLFAKILKSVGFSKAPDEDTPSLTVSVTVGYWRKANQVHAWFVKNVQDGVDECLEHDVSREQLIQLKTDCQFALANRGQAAELLPPQSGFFFGSTELDDGYFEDLQHTVELLDKLLNDEKLKDWSFTYRSSW